MPNVMPSDIVTEVRDVLRAASTGKGSRPTFLTAYQILGRLPEPLRARLIQERGVPGSGAGQCYAGASVVQGAAQMLNRTGEVEIAYLDTAGLTFDIGEPVEVSAGYQVCGIYRLIPKP